MTPNRIASSIEPHMAIADVARAGLQVSTGAGAGDTFATFWQKERTVTGALDQPAGAVEELIGHPFQRNPAVGAAIEINKGALALTNHHQHFTAAVDAQATRVGKRVKTAQRAGQEIIVVSHQSIIPVAICQRQPGRALSYPGPGGGRQE